MINIWKSFIAWCRNNDYVILIPPAVVLIVLCGVAGLWWWFWLFLNMSVLVLVSEIAASILTEVSLSDQFRRWRGQHPMMSRAILISFLLLAVTLVWHLGRQAAG